MDVDGEGGAKKLPPVNEVGGVTPDVSGGVMKLPLVGGATPDVSGEVSTRPPVSEVGRATPVVSGGVMNLPLYHRSVRLAERLQVVSGGVMKTITGQ